MLYFATLSSTLNMPLVLHYILKSGAPYGDSFTLAIMLQEGRKNEIIRRLNLPGQGTKLHITAIKIN